MQRTHGISSFHRSYYRITRTCLKNLTTALSFCGLVFAIFCASKHRLVTSASRSDVPYDARHWCTFLATSSRVVKVVVHFGVLAQVFTGKSRFLYISKSDFHTTYNQSLLSKCDWRILALSYPAMSLVKAGRLAHETSILQSAIKQFYIFI